MLNTENFIIKELKDKIISRGDLPYISVEKQLEYVEELSNFPLGRFLLVHRCFDAYWTKYILDFSIEESNNTLFPLEKFILNNSLFVKAWKEVFIFYKKLTQLELRNKITLASIPCGMMEDILSLDFSNISNYKIIGIDIDSKTLKNVKNKSKKKKFFKALSLLQQDAWHLKYKNELDLIVSCGLNIYESDKEKVLSLYKQFYSYLKPNGKLIISFLTYPEDDKNISEWKVNEISPQDLFLEKILYKDILNMKFRNYRTSNEFIMELKEAGFNDIVFYYDKFHIFPTVIARK